MCEFIEEMVISLLIIILITIGIIYISWIGWISFKNSHDDNEEDKKIIYQPDDNNIEEGNIGASFLIPSLSE